MLIQNVNFVLFELKRQTQTNDKQQLRKVCNSSKMENDIFVFILV